MPRTFLLLYFGALILTPGPRGASNDGGGSWPAQWPLAVARGEANAPASVVPAPPAEALSAAPRDGFQSVTFRQLSDAELVLNDKGACQEVRLSSSLTALDGAAVALAGFVIPTRLAGDKVTEFLLVPSQQDCCFGQALQPNQWVEVRSVNPLKLVTDRPIALYGVLHVSPQRASSVVTGLYRMDAQIASEEVPRR